jgi:hypothetical protein
MADSKNLKFEKQINRSKNTFDGFVTRDSIMRKGLKMRKKIESYWDKRNSATETYYRKRRFR